MTAQVNIKAKGGSIFKCGACTAVFRFEPQDSETTLEHCPSCGGTNNNPETRFPFDADSTPLKDKA